MRRVVLVQLPIPPLGPEPIRGNVPLAAAYLKMFAEGQGLGADWHIELFPTALANTLGDEGIVEALLSTDAWLVGFSCYLWNIERTLWIAQRLKQRRPELRILLGGPEITADNGWVLNSPGVDWAAIGEGEQTFAELLTALRRSAALREPIPGLVACSAPRAGRRLPMIGDGPAVDFLPRPPLERLDPISSPYLVGILDAADEQMLLLETLRGCVFKCKFCYYPKSYDDLHYVAEEKILANLEHARRRGAREVILLDPTLNQGRHFDSFVELLIRGNPDRQFTYFGELRAEGITAKTARLLRQANFTEVEIGLQSIDRKTMALMDRKNNLRAVERGIAALRAEGIRVKVDLIVGLPGDTVASVRRGFDYLRRQQLYDDVQVFNLAILPGTAFRHEAADLGLVYQPRPPYYVLHTPTLTQADLFMLMGEAQEVFEMDWDPLPPPVLPTESGAGSGLATHWQVDLDAAEPLLPLAAPARRAQAFTLWLRSAHWPRHGERCRELVRGLLADNPFSTLQVVLEPLDDPTCLRPSWLAALWAATLERPSYLDKYYALQPGRPMGAKRLVVLLPWAWRDVVEDGWINAMTEHASLVWRDPPAGAELGEEEFAMPATLDAAR
jgi:radical SAM superfamily enzyme YgiQ (UPF0313 family)